ncbi:cytochrome c biogenesis protein ResB [Halobacteriovorax sp. ZH4_bin.1]|uniref:cytochrome c biogenesis protein ResB n=2 Tax=Halobacteriovorax TaxID=1652133 RepID=UPI003712ADF4
MVSNKFNYKYFERSIGSMKFAVFIISLFSLAMIVGTFVESYYGTDFVGRLIYKTWWFMAIQFFMGLSILFAALIRLPLKKRLYGFYTIHTGLIIIGIGSFVTYIAGIDGTIHLQPMTPTRQVVLNEDVIEITRPDENTRAVLPLPYSAFDSSIDVTYKEIEIKEYIPFADKVMQWLPAKDSVNDSDNMHSSSYIISNDNVAQDFTLSLHPEAFDFQASLSMGLLSITYLPKTLAPCFSTPSDSGLILWDSRTSQCYTAEEKNIKVEETATNKRFFVIKDGENVYSFLPDLSPWALDQNLKPAMNAPIRVFSKNLFKEKPNLFLFGDSASFFDKDADKWISQNFDNQGLMSLPWMGFTLKLVRNEKNLVPTMVPESTLPIQQNGGLVKGMTRAAKIQVRDKEYWLTDDKPVSVLIDGVKTNVYLTKRSFLLPFEFTLTRFKMDKDPGTNRPASYESFVNLFTDGATTPYHVYMNNPLKYDGFTFYQASYSQDPETGQYSSTLSVNLDQGRWIKYLGSILLVLGSLWHYYLNYRPKRKTKDLLGLEVADSDQLGDKK